VSKNKSILHWYDFLCPFCYVGQNRTAILLRHGLDVVELPFQAHPDVPALGVSVGPRKGEMYSHLEREAKQAGLILNWPARLPNTRRALAAADWSGVIGRRSLRYIKTGSLQRTLLPARISEILLLSIGTRRKWGSMSTLSMPPYRTGAPLPR
jgi:2-hydroxychromene-2-carboxylate isomerase